MSELTTVARPYAKAAFDFAVEHGALQEWQNMLFFAAAVAEHDNMRTFLKSAVGRDQTASVFISVCGEQLDEKGQNFIKVLAANERLSTLPAVAQAYIALRADYDNEVSVDVTSAVALDKEQQAKLSAALEKRLARKVKLNCSVNPEIIGGLLIQAGDTVIDGTLKSKLAKLAYSLQS
ncbi:F0F1 ATP synthase subunit delta [Aliidiomarina minuta]|uniref:ATP synthase subunit delta n=1 Tax=Aliidiomarina minuta TaxID=880057 RepID=A0A432WAE5_9GAMM|nr:F0F1 ATP synthase subunit delta [Aliidiomarina minuta]RUO27005.1 F0F1 ATP synthase subunit delta [Aliidiomarina minuta]